jgi:hypothetical protein
MFILKYILLSALLCCLIINNIFASDAFLEYQKMLSQMPGYADKTEKEMIDERKKLLQHASEQENGISKQDYDFFKRCVSVFGIGGQLGT